MAREIHASYEAKDNQRKVLIKGGWLYSEAIRKAPYVTNGDSYSMVNPYLNLACCSININVTTLPTATGAVLLDNLPIPTRDQYIQLSGQSNRTLRGYIDTSGQLVIDIVPANTGWYAGAVSYPCEGAQGSSGSDDIRTQSKTATPSWVAQTITPDAPDYNYLSQVSVESIPISYSDNTAGGQTVTVGQNE